MEHMTEWTGPRPCACFHVRLTAEGLARALVPPSEVSVYADVLFACVGDDHDLAPVPAE